MFYCSVYVINDLQLVGGIKSTNVLRTLHGAVSSTGHALDGVAIVSDIIGSSDPSVSARKLAVVIRAFKSSSALAPGAGLFPVPAFKYTAESIKTSVSSLLTTIKTMNPLVHQVNIPETVHFASIANIQQITKTVVTNQSANATLALGASPIMATAPEEMEDLSRVVGALLVNFGTITDKEGMLLAGECRENKVTRSMQYYS